MDCNRASQSVIGRCNECGRLTHRRHASQGNAASRTGCRTVDDGYRGWVESLEVDLVRTGPQGTFPLMHRLDKIRCYNITH
jgi:hypothetical protein